MDNTLYIGRQKRSDSPSHVDNGIFIRQNEYLRKFLFTDIQWLEASGNYCYIHLANHASIIVVEHLSTIEKALPKETFQRIHRSYIININAVEAFIGNRICIGKARINISAPYRKTIMSCFNILGIKE